MRHCPNLKKPADAVDPNQKNYYFIFNCSRASFHAMINQCVRTWARLVFSEHRKKEQRWKNKKDQVFIIRIRCVLIFLMRNRNLPVLLLGIFLPDRRVLGIFPQLRTAIKPDHLQRTLQGKYKQVNRYFRNKMAAQQMKVFQLLKATQLAPDFPDRYRVVDWWKCRYQPVYCQFSVTW